MWCWFAPLQDLTSGWRMNPTGQLQRTPVDVSLQVLSQPPLFTAHVSEKTDSVIRNVWFTAWCYFSTNIFNIDSVYVLKSIDCMDSLYKSKDKEAICSAQCKYKLTLTNTTLSTTCAWEKHMWNVPLHHQGVFYNRKIRRGELWVPSHFTVYLKDCGMPSLPRIWFSKYMRYRLTQCISDFSTSTSKISNAVLLYQTK